MSTDKSDFWSGIGTGIVILSIGLSIGGCRYLCHKGESLIIRAQMEQQIIEAIGKIEETKGE